jgi:hypothetical protein
MLFTATQAQMAPPHGYRQPFVSGSIWSLPGAYGRLVLVLLVLVLVLSILLLLVLSLLSFLLLPLLLLLLLLLSIYIYHYSKLTEALHFLGYVPKLLQKLTIEFVSCIPITICKRLHPQVVRSVHKELWHPRLQGGID